MPAKGFALMIWSEPEGCWASLAVSDRRSRVEALRERLAYFSHIETEILSAASCADVDVEAAARDLEPPFGVLFIRPDACSS